jgi:hypothetical protein
MNCSNNVHPTGPPSTNKANGKSPVMERKERIEMSRGKPFGTAKVRGILLTKRGLHCCSPHLITIFLTLNIYL